MDKSASLSVDRTIDDLSDIGVMKSAHATSGVRGATGRDTAQRSLRAETEKLVQMTRDAVTEAAGPGEPVTVSAKLSWSSGTDKKLPASLCDCSRSSTRR